MDGPNSAYNFHFKTYQSHIYSIQKDDIYAAIRALEIGHENTRELLASHEREFGRTTKKNQMWAEQLEQDLTCIQSAIKALKENPKEQVDFPPLSPSV